MAKMDTLLFFCLGIVFCTVVNSTKAPVLIWTNDDSQSLPSSLSGHTWSQDDFQTKYLNIISKEEHNIIVFIQDMLSLDEISKHADVYSTNSDGATYQHLKDLMESHHSTHLPSVTSPTESFHELRQHFNGIVHEVPNTAESLSEVPLDRVKRNLVLVNLPQTKHAGEAALTKIDGILGKMSEEMKALDKPFTALYTAHGSSKVPGEHLYLGRHLLAEPADTNGTFINATCVWFYTLQVDLNVGVLDKFTLPKNPKFEPMCKNNTAQLKLTYDPIPGLTNVAFMFNFTTKNGRWQLDGFLASYKVNGNTTAEGTDQPMDTTFITETPLGFSYHCYQGGKVGPKGGNTSEVAITFKGLQVQAFKWYKDEFGYPNDCIGFFTIPIWSGIIVTFILLAVLTFGIVMLASITTMDRYDDPKGKAITVNVME